MKKLALNILRDTACLLALALGVPAAHADYASTVNSLSPIGYWRFSEPTQPVVPTYPLNNSSTAGAALNGLYYGVPSLGGPGVNPPDTAASFSGNLQYAEVPNNAALNPTGPFTVEFWANLTNDTAGAKSGVVSRYITVAGGPTAQLGYLFFANNGNTAWQFRVYNGSAATTITDANGAPDITANTWYHVAGVYDGANITIYVNGVPTSTTTGTVVYRANTNAPTRIGAGTPETAPSLFFPGLIDNVAVFNSALSASQINAHYSAASSNTAGYNLQILADNPTAYYAMGESALPAYIPYAATNSGSLGSALDGKYSLAGSTSGVAGPLRGQYAGFEADNKSVALNGTSGQIDIPATALSTDTFTFTGWVKRNGSQVNASPFLLQRASGSPATGMVVDFSNRLGYVWNDDAGTYNFNPGVDFYIQDGVWTFAAVTVTPTNATLYIGGTNGLKSVTRTGTHAAHDFSGGPMAIGRDTGSGTRFVKGNLDEIAIFNQALDSATISNLFYSATPAIPMVLRSPADPLFEGMTVSFTAYGVGSVPVSYQWRKGGVNLAGKTSSTLVLTNVSTSASGNYDVVVTGASLSVTSAVSAITVVAGPPIITQQPVSATRYEGAAVTFAVTIQGSTPWSFQWKKGGSPITGATNSSYTIPAVHPVDAASYNVTITNPLGSSNSAAATLTVLPVDNYAAQVIYSGAGAYWQLNETNGTTAFDYAGGLNCTITGNVTNNVASVRPPSYIGYGATNTCFAFPGGNATENLATPTLANFTNNSLTMAAWVMPYSGQLALTSDVNFVANAGGAGLNSAGTDGKVRAHPLWGSDTGLTFSFDTWNYIVVVWTPTGQTFYLDNGDGNGLRTSSVGGTIDPSTWKNTPFYIGRQVARSDRGWPGQIDEVALFDRALSATEVTNLYVNAISGATAPNIISQPASQTVLVGHPVTFTVGAIGGAPLTYQWRHAGTNIPGATSRSLTIASPYYTDAGSYDATVANGIGSPVASATATLVVEAPSTFAFLTNDLVLHLRFDGTYLDASGNTNDATPTDLSGLVSYVPGKIGVSGLLVGTNGYVTVAPAPSLSFGPSDSFSVSFWVKCGPGNNDIPIIGNAINSTYQDGWVFSEDGGKIEWTLAGVGDSSSVIADPVPGSPIITDGVWHHVAVTFDRTLTVALTYVDGNQVDSRSIAGLGSLDSLQAIAFGNDPTGGYIWDPVTYQIDDVGIWRRVLTPSQATGIYAAGQNGRSFDVKGPGSLTLKKSGANLELIWQEGTLQSVDSIGGTWVNVPGATAPYHVVTPSAASKLYRVQF